MSHPRCRGDAPRPGRRGSAGSGRPASTGRQPGRAAPRRRPRTPSPRTPRARPASPQTRPDEAGGPSALRGHPAAGLWESACRHLTDRWTRLPIVHPDPGLWGSEWRKRYGLLRGWGSHSEQNPPTKQVHHGQLCIDADRPNDIDSVIERLSLRRELVLFLAISNPLSTRPSEVREHPLEVLALGAGQLGPRAGAVHFARAGRGYDSRSVR